MYLDFEGMNSMPIPTGGGKRVEREEDFISETLNIEIKVDPALVKATVKEEMRKLEYKFNTLVLVVLFVFAPFYFYSVFSLFK